MNPNEPQGAPSRTPAASPLEAARPEQAPNPGDLSGPPEASRVLALALILSGAIFVAALAMPVPVAMGALYIVPVLISLWAARTRITVGVALCATVLSLIELATHLSRTIEYGLAPPFVNTTVAIFAIWVTARLGLWRLSVERSLAATERRTATTLESLAEGVISVDLAGRIVMVNPAAERLTGWTNERAQGRVLEDVFRLGGPPTSPGFPGVEAGTEDGPNPRPGLLLRTGRDPVPLEHTSATLIGGDGQAMGTVTVFRDVTRRRRNEEAIRNLAYHDELTGLPNRTSFLDRLQLEIAHARRDKKHLAVLFLDLDGFKKVNDSVGHAAGDRLLREVAQRMTAVLRDGDTVARLGGDEFTVILPGVEHRTAAELVATKLDEALRLPFSIEGHLLPVGTSTGIAIYPEDGDDAVSLLERSDAAMYREKHGARSARRRSSSKSHAKRNGRSAAADRSPAPKQS